MGRGRSEGKRAIDVFATLVLLFVVAVHSAMLFDKVRATWADNVLTYDLHLPTWPFFAVAWAATFPSSLSRRRAYGLTFTPKSLRRPDHQGGRMRRDNEFRRRGGTALLRCLR